MESKKAEEIQKKAESDASKMLKEAEQKARLIIEEAKKKADAEAGKIIAEAEQKGRQIMEEAKKKADFEAKANKIIAEAEQKARQIIEEAQKIAAAPAEQRPQQIIKAIREKATQETKGKTEEQASSKKRVEILIAPPVDFAQLEKLRASLQRLPDLRILSIGGSPAGGTQISMMMDKPAPIAESLRGIDIVQEAIEEEMLASHPLGDILKKTMPGTSAKRPPDEQRVLVVLKRAP